MTPLVSIIMPCFQQADFLEEAVRSVLEQSVAEVELLVMDPGSTDGSRELLLGLQKEFGERLILHFEKDRGQSDAVNRGMAMARGKVLGWLNSDDRLHPGTLQLVCAVLNVDEPAWLYGRCGIIDADSKAISSLITRYKDWRGRRFSLAKLLTENFISQMAVFWNAAMWRQAGGLDIDKHLDMDYDLWLRFAEVAEPSVLPVELADFRVHGAAKGSTQTEAQLDAAYATACEHAGRLGVNRSVLALHRLLSWRTRMIYRITKPS